MKISIQAAKRGAAPAMKGELADEVISISRKHTGIMGAAPVGINR